MFEDLWDFDIAPFSGLSRLRADLNNLLGVTEGEGLFNLPSLGGFPLVNVGETNQDVHVYVLAPGMDANDVEINLEGNLLSIRGTRHTDAEDDKANGDRTWYRHERFHGDFLKTVTLPEVIDPDRIDAKAKNGIITITIAKRAETQPRKIDIKLQ